MVSRREFSKLALAAIPVAALGGIDSKIHGVQIGVQSYSFRDRSLDDAIKGMVEAGLGEYERYEGHVQPKMSHEEVCPLRTPLFMVTLPTGRKTIDDASVSPYPYHYLSLPHFT